jgi:hypothetical protein
MATSALVISGRNTFHSWEGRAPSRPTFFQQRLAGVRNNVAVNEQPNRHRAKVRKGIDLMKNRNRLRFVIGLSILASFLLLTFGIFIRIRPVTAVQSSTESSSSRSPAGVVAKANSQLPERRDQEQPTAPPTRPHSDFWAPRGSVSEFSGFTTGDQPITSVSASSAPKEEEKAPLPLALKTVDPKAIQVTPEQQQIINALRQNFIDKLATAKLNPDDPRYAALWAQLQPEIDQQLRALLGQEFFLQYEHAATVEK